MFLIRDAVEEITGIHTEPEIGAIPYYPNQAMHLEADILNLTEETGYTSDFTFDRGIRETIQWYLG